MKKRETLSRWLIAPLLVGLLWTSCAKEEVAVLDVPTSAEQVASTKVEQSPFLTEEEAEAQAANLYAAFFADELRSSRPPRVKDVRLLDPFRSSQDSLGGIYVVNFENNGGYIMMAEHRHGEPILAACPQGNFDPDKALENPNFVPILDNMRALVASGRDRDPNDRPGSKPEVDTEVHVVGYDPWEEDEVLSPLLPVAWGQNEPFNDMLPKKANGEAPDAGCVPTAVAQILAYYRKPAYLDWDAIISASQKGKLMKEQKVANAVGVLYRGLGELLKIEYPNYSGASSLKVPRVLLHYDMNCHPDFQDYNWRDIYSELREFRPVYIKGYDVRIKNKKGEYDYEPGHAWVLDGYKTFKRKVHTVRHEWEDKQDSNNMRWKPIHGHYYEWKHFVHCNFGWNGADDGYYLSSVFDTNKGPDIEDKVEDKYMAFRSIKEGEEFYFQYKLQILINIRPMR